jgi:hypothetical protein
VTCAPASTLSLEGHFDGALLPGAQVTIRLRIADAAHGQDVALTNQQFFTVNGVRVPEPPPPSGQTTIPFVRFVTVPRQPPGGSYRFVYTDERGQQTTFVVPAPQADFVVTSPAPMAHVPIPAPSSGALTVHYTVPFPVSAFPSTPTSELPPVHYTEDTVMATASGSFQSGFAGTVLASDQQSPTGTVTIVNTGFQHLVSGPGTIRVSATVAWFLLARAGFAAIQMGFHDTVEVPIFWVP